MNKLFSTAKHAAGTGIHGLLHSICGYNEDEVSTYDEDDYREDSAKVITDTNRKVTRLHNALVVGPILMSVAVTIQGIILSNKISKEDED